MQPLRDRPDTSASVVEHMISAEGDVCAAMTRSPFPSMTPERALILGVLRRALEDYMIPVSSTHKKIDRRDAVEWIFSPSTEQWSYIDDCEQLGLDYQLIRRKLEAKARITSCA